MAEMATKKKKPKTLADLGKIPLAIGKVYILPREVTEEILDKINKSKNGTKKQ